MTATLQISEHETWFLLDQIGSARYWPPLGYQASNFMYSFVPEDERDQPGAAPSGGPNLRVRLMAIYQKFQETPGRYLTLPLEISGQEAWLLDDVLWNVKTDMRYYFLPDGQPLVGLAQRVYGILTKMHDEDLPDYLRKSGPADGAPVPGASTTADKVIHRIEDDWNEGKAVA